ncbi:MAG: DNA-processing protein DprA [Candidatus Eisenbacteria bacterium]
MRARLGTLDAARVALLHVFSPKQQRMLAEAMASAEGARLGSESLPLRGLRLRERKADMVRALPDDAATDEIVDEWGRQGFTFLRWQDEGFPRELWEIPDPPLHLFARGAFRLADDRRPRVAVVGSRAASSAGLRLSRELGRDLALAGCVVVSGLARGIDAAAHKGGLAAGGDTLAVLGTGLDRVYPPEHVDLAEEIVTRGALITEFAPGTPPLPLHFPRRNRILVGLADALVVVEGTERSGARSSVDHALDQGKDVFAVPRDPLHEGSELPNRLLREGAFPLVSASDVVQLLADPRRRRTVPASPTAAPSGSPTGDPGCGPSGSPTGDPGCGPSRVPTAVAAADRHVGPADRIRAVLSLRTGRSLEEISGRVGYGTTQELIAALGELELGGWIRKDAGGRWYLRRAVTSPA